MNTYNNFYQGQLQYSSQIFSPQQELFSIICSDSQFAQNNCYLRRIGIMGHPGDIVTLGGEKITIGKTGIYEIDNIEIKSLKFKINENVLDTMAIIDYILIKEN